MIIHRLLVNILTGILIFTLFVSCRANLPGKTPEINSTQTAQAQTKTTQPTSNQTIVYGDLVIKEQSDYLMIPVNLSEESNQNKDSLFRNPSSYEYDRQLIFDNIIFYRKQDGESHLLLNKKAKITSFDTLEKKDSGKPSTYFLIYKIIDTDTNGDKKLNYEDGTIGYLSDLAGKNIQQITPNNTQISNWTVVQSISSIFVKIIKDSDKDKKFTERDETAYIKVNLDQPKIGTEIISDQIKQQIKSISGQK